MVVSKAEKLLVAAGALACEGKVDFTAEDLVVKAHLLFPGDFSLKGYKQHPDSNIVLTQIMGIKAPLIVRGWVEKTGAKQYRVTPKGLHDLAARSAVSDSVGLAVDAVVSIERKQDEAIGRLMTSSAFELFKAGRQHDITFHQFCRFVGLSARDKWQRVAGRLTAVRHLADEARKFGETGQALKVYLEHNYAFAPEDLRSLAALYDYLLQRFSLEMAEWRQHAT